MRVLLVNPMLPPSFWSNPEQCVLVGKKTVSPPLGLITVAAMLPEDWQLRLLDLNVTNIAGEDWEWADLVMVSAMIVQKDGMLELIGEAKRRNRPVVVGGPYPSSIPNVALEAGCDYVFRGEVENSIHTLLNALIRNEKGGVYEAPEKADMTKSPVPRFDLLEMDKYIAVSMQTSRGCPFDCEFCDIVNLYGRKPRYKTPDQVIRELEVLKKLGWRNDVFISDDNFIGSRSNAIALLNKIRPWMKQNGEPFCFATQASVNLGQDIELIDLMTEANFASVFVGIESPDENILSSVNKLQNIRNPLLESLRNINKNGLNVWGSFIMGFDGEKKGMGQRIVEFVEAANIPIAMLNTLHALPNTKLWERLKKEGRLKEWELVGNTTVTKFNFIPTRPESEIRAEYSKAWEDLYEPSAFLARNLRCFLERRPTREAIKGKQSSPKDSDDGKNQSIPDKLQKQLLPFLRLCWRQGVLSPGRFQFWRQILTIVRRNPSRAAQYIISCAMAEDMYRLRDIVKDKISDPADT
jgi:radical SAM superfamily enzyme YgiQ (UPF0313 family)